MSKNVISLRMALPRKSFCRVATHEVHLKGISGPGAPHVFAFDRIEDLPGQRYNFRLSVIASKSI